MMRPTLAMRPLLRSFARVPARQAQSFARPTLMPRSVPGTAMKLYKPLNTSLVRHASAVASASSSNAQEHDVDTLEAIKGDMRVIRQTFSLKDVPRETLYLGLAGVIPYAATSLSTLYLAWDINHADLSGTSGWLLNPEQATQILAVLEPLQIGWGAVILSFLGAIHWGFEFAKYNGSHLRRYAIGVAAPAIAWPTIFMPVEAALITQFLAFTGFYYIDSKAGRRGWAPPWYGIYRFVLTFFVGVSIVVTLIGRGQILFDRHARPKIGRHLEAQKKDHSMSTTHPAEPIRPKDPIDEVSK